MRPLTLLAFGLFLACSDAASAADFMSACNTKTLCAGVQPGGGRIIQCLKEHKSALSTKCKVALGEMLLNQPNRAPPAGAPAAGGSAPQGAAAPQGDAAPQQGGAAPQQ